MGDRLPLPDHRESPTHGYPLHLGYSDPEAFLTKQTETSAMDGSSAKQGQANSANTPRIDYVLVFEDQLAGASAKSEKIEHLRDLFMAEVKEEGIKVQDEKVGNYICRKLHVPFERLCKEAASINLEMPLKGCEITETNPPSCWVRFEKKHLQTDDEIDFISTPFQNDKRHIYEGIENQEMFFRPSHRSILANHILINIDVRQKINVHDQVIRTQKGLPWMLHHGVFCDNFILHDETARDPAEKEELEQILAANGDSPTLDAADQQNENKTLQLPDTRRELHQAWARFRFKYQPLWKIRNYFGEKIALYFAWSGTLIATLWVPTLFGLVVFSYGLWLSITGGAGDTDKATNITNTSAAINKTGDELIQQVKAIVDTSLTTIQEAFDNNATPFFALVICLWGTVFLEIWKRKNSTLAYEWDVNGFEEMEPDRPQFYGTKTRADPVTNHMTWYYPLKKQLLKYATSSSVLIIMVVMVFISVAGVILYRVLMTVDYCGEVSSITCLLLSSVISSVLNAVSILILGKLYDRLALWLTNWENHRTQTKYDDALIIKLFAFQFANSYTSLFYIAFFRNTTWSNGIFGLGSKYQDACTGNSCMAMLSLQVLVLMLMKPLPKFLKDIVLTWLLKKWKKRTWFRRKVHPKPTEKLKCSSFLKREFVKANLGDFTLSEYTEKVILYGFLMLFAASFPLAPLIALLIGIIDIRVDAYRMLWMNRRPLGRIAQDIGMWFNILRFLNIVGVISNGFLIAFTSSYGRQFDLVGKLWIVIIFEHAVLGLKFFLDWVIPNVSRKVELQLRQDKYKVGQILDKAAQEKGRCLSVLVDKEEGTLVSNGTDSQVYEARRTRKKNKKKRRSGSDHTSAFPAGLYPVLADIPGPSPRQVTHDDGLGQS